MIVVRHAISERRSGVKHHNWKGGAVPSLLQQRVVRERTPGPSCPQTPAGGLGAWQGWSCNQQTLSLTVRRLFVAYRSFIVHRQCPLDPVDPLFEALSGRLKFTVRRHKFSKDSLSAWSNPKPETRNTLSPCGGESPKPETLKPETRNPKPETRNPETRNPNPKTRNLETRNT